MFVIDFAIILGIIINSDFYGAFPMFVAMHTSRFESPAFGTAQGVRYRSAG